MEASCLLVGRSMALSFWVRVRVTKRILSVGKEILKFSNSVGPSLRDMVIGLVMCGICVMVVVRLLSDDLIKIFVLGELAHGRFKTLVVDPGFGGELAWNFNYNTGYGRVR